VRRQIYLIIFGKIIAMEIIKCRMMIGVIAVESEAVPIQFGPGLPFLIILKQKL